ncbi:MAG TPA: indolepyruvate oxidoreductase subunit beta [Methanosarcina thermophila]|jgi:indolepyruvate ferredoxin oxidoreductase beta subunit|uniref:Indolepyruvate ferredoxin oxidoreductase subunit beta n=2 Tax=Methanosarcina thermophila TaxID=2210 RepID=A0A3G9CS75_METTE|nr:indolepyruvate oxidoreductase subunit beta [Methanosarcina thermophila]AKB12958.1 Indolepyruvate oxidoreductase subunit IorB [Methanosarcina thermophila TM-1]BAW27940.1 indolepyruvate ferredoxin oxidoreductase, subunit iorB [Methanosarcina thermophila]HOA70081.1 indolepyruvate oxidoreductase subunit beta [Methanosarcina thermophila]HOQ66858.1 indolepyruvate oxidoreductase subunit beta [Methanosarcina thermophila]HPT82006.1 indolepyruvate oxidoreductase subunit beta [Methanosarcina thermophi
MSQAEQKKFDLLITGVGGQGAILASDIIGKAAVTAGLPIRAAETHGMAQRGGSVVNHIRIGQTYGSMIPKKGADLMLALEPMEAVRYLDFLKDGGIIIVNTQPVVPVTVTSGQAKYPEVSDILDALSEKYIVKAFNADELAFEAGSRLAMNVVMVGAVSGYLPIPKETLIESVKALVPQKTIEVNLRAFEAGRQKVEES